MGPQPMPAAEVTITPELVRDLLHAQHPRLAEFPLRLAGNGWDNVLYRLGDDLAVRLPRRAVAADLVAAEQRWLPELAGRLPLPIPAPVAIGRPGFGYPWPWSVVPWFGGDIAVDAPPRDPDATAERLASFLRALHQAAPPDAPANPYRGVPLRARDEMTRQWIEQLASTLDVPAVTRQWEHVLAVPEWDGPPLWLHGDLHPANLVVAEGELVAVIDFGDLTAGDPATDLSVAWMLLLPGARDRFRRAYGRADDSTWARARGWALAQALAHLARSADAPANAALGARTLEAVLPDDGA